MINKGGLVRLTVAALFVAFSAGTSSKAQSGQSGTFGVGSIHKGLAVGAIVAVAAVAGAGITYLILHSRGVAVGCITETGGTRTFRASNDNIYSLLDGGPSQSIPVGHRLKVKGHKSGSVSSASFQVQKVLKDYGPC